MFQVNVKGADELNRAFQTLGVRVQRKIMSTALRKAARLVQDDAKASAPVRTGRIKKSIVIRVGRYKKGGPVRMRIVIIGAYRGPTSYAGPLELGHRIVSGRVGVRKRFTGKVAPRPFMRTAARRQKDRVLKVVADQVRYGIAQEAAVGTIK